MRFTKSTALFNLKNFTDALPVLEHGAKIAERNNEKKQNLFTDLIAKCQKEIPAPKPEKVEEVKKEEPAVVSQASAAPVPPAQPQIRFTSKSNQT